MKNNTKEPIALVGMAFRLPGDTEGEAALWQALQSGRDLVGKIPPERWATEELQHDTRSEAGRSITYDAGVLSRIEAFDARFFGIAPREAAWMDPQQRLLLELAWEAMEEGGFVPETLAGQKGAVFVGISSLDYGVRGMADMASMTGHFMTGNTFSIAANRLSYIFDLRGPSMAVDTACSSALVALHQACAVLRNGEAPFALVGSINLLMHPYPFVGFTKASMISARGRCRTFDASADGYVRAEGGGVVMLKPLSQAEKDGDTIHAVILASGVNADGAEKSGLTIPNRAGQVALMRDVLAESGLTQNDIDYIEAHGTGTTVGDPVEAGAIGDVYGVGRAAPLPIGSVKTNLGHLEAASGMAGLAKVLTMLKYRALPPSLHFTTPSPHIDFTGLNLRVVTHLEKLDSKAEQPLVMGVNSFGFGGANAHVLLREYRAEAPAPSRLVESEVMPLVPPPPLVLSARTPEALRSLAGRYATFIRENPSLSTYDISYAAAKRRQMMEHRALVRCPDRMSAVAALEVFAAGGQDLAILTEEKVSEPAKIAFVYSGNGSQWLGMGQVLLRESTVFAARMQELDAVMRDHAGFSVLATLQDINPNVFTDTAYAQPVLFALQVALTDMLSQRGITPDCVAGHSVGEVAAAYTAGALSLEQAITVICARSVAQASTRGCGRMAAVGMSPSSVRELLAHEGFVNIEVAGINSPQNVTLAGPEADIAALGDLLKTRHIVVKILALDYAFHSRAMDEIASDLAARLKGLSPQKTSIDFVSTVSGRIIDGKALHADYWWQNVRQPVLFEAAIAAMADLGVRIFIEIAPHAILQRYINECLDASSLKGRVLPTLRRKDDGLKAVEATIERARLCMLRPNLSEWFPVRGKSLSLPTYPWQREVFWLPQTAESYGLIERRRVHPLLGWPLSESTTSYENMIDISAFPYLADHRVGGAVVFPAAGYVDMALALAREWLGGDAFALEDLEIRLPMVFDGDLSRQIRCDLLPQDGTFSIRSRTRLSHDEWTVHATGRILDAGGGVGALPKVAHIAAGTVIEKSDHYEAATSIGLDYGPAFQSFAQGLIHGTTIAGRLVLPERLLSENYLLHPVMLDGALQSLLHFFGSELALGTGYPFLPVRIGRMLLLRDQTVARFQINLTKRGRRSVQADIVLLDENGGVIGVCQACRFRAAPQRRNQDTVPTEWVSSAELCPHPKDPYDPLAFDFAACVEAAFRSFARNEKSLKRDLYYSEALPLMNALVVSFAYEALQDIKAKDPLWLKMALSAPQTLPNDKRAYVSFLTRCLFESDLLRVTAGTPELSESAPPGSTDIWRALLAEFPDCFAELLFMGRTGQHLASWLYGDESALANFDDSAFAPALFEQGAPYHAANCALQDMIGQMAASWPQTRRFRVLEISGAAYQLPHMLLPALANSAFDYVIAATDSKRADHFRSEYQKHQNVSVATLNPATMDLTAETTLPDQFDVIIVHHWLHSAQAPADMISALCQKLSVVGRLVLVERPPGYAVDFIFGVKEGWWRETSKGTVSRLREARAWQAMLSASGYSKVETISEALDTATGACSYIIVAHAAQVERSYPEIARQSWLLIGDDKCDALQHLATQLRSEGQDVEIRESCHLAEKSFQHIVSLPDMTAVHDDTGHARRCLDLLALVKTLEGEGATTPCLWIITKGGNLASCAGDAPFHPSETALVGFGRVLMNEQPHLRCTLIDWPQKEEKDFALRLSRELTSPDGESEIILLSSARYVVRHHKKETYPARAKGPARTTLEFTRQGHLRDLAWVEASETSLQDDEIEVRPAAAGINFRDVMYTMGLLPDEAVEKGFAGATLGLECAGTVTRTGRNVKAFKVGDEVMGFAPACFASYVITKAEALSLKPEAWSFAEAATVPTAFFTVYYALKHLAALQAGERVLIHGGAGGVGIAALQIARHLGAEIFVTVGSDEKRDFVRLLGADHVFDSRSYAFADQILELTGGEGVDVVLNSLAGEAIRQNLRVLRSFGRFLELGKRDFFENTAIGLRPFKDNISYFGIDADQLLIAKPTLAAKLFSEMMGLFKAGVLSPLPHSIYPAERAIDAFRFMQQARHIGKVVLDMETGVMDVRQAAGKVHNFFKPESSYLITGGLSGFGLETAVWMAEQGAEHLILIGRRGSQTPGLQEGLKRIEAAGADAHIYACDVTDYDALCSTLADAARSAPPLRGIIHAAMALDDTLLGSMDHGRFMHAFAPKAQGAWNLHRATRNMSLDLFVLYGSVTTMLGNPGQGNYVAANAYMEGLAELRRSQGLQALCVSWGPIADVGYLERNQALKDALSARLGGLPLTSRQALATLGRLLAEKRTGVTVADLDWATLARVLPSATSRRFSYVAREAASGSAQHEGPLDIQRMIAGKNASEIATILRGIVSEEVAKIMCVGADRVDPARSLQDQGMDSLMAVELALAMERRFGIQLPAMMLSDGSGSVEYISLKLARRLSGDASEEEITGLSLEAKISAVAAQHSEILSPEDIAQTLQEMNAHKDTEARRSA